MISFCLNNRFLRFLQREGLSVRLRNKDMLQMKGLIGIKNKAKFILFENQSVILPYLGTIVFYHRL